MHVAILQTLLRGQGWHKLDCSGLVHRSQLSCYNQLCDIYHQILQCRAHNTGPGWTPAVVCMQYARGLLFCSMQRVEKNHQCCNTERCVALLDFPTRKRLQAVLKIRAPLSLPFYRHHRRAEILLASNL